MEILAALIGALGTIIAAWIAVRGQAPRQPTQDPSQLREKQAPEPDNSHVYQQKGSFDTKPSMLFKYWVVRWTIAGPIIGAMIGLVLGVIDDWPKADLIAFWVVAAAGWGILGGIGVGVIFALVAKPK